jgi:hypothetical protein
MSDPRNVAHAKKVTQEKKHHGTDGRSDASAVQPGKKPRAATKRRDPGVAPTALTDTAAGESAVPSASPTPEPSPALEGSLVVLREAEGA